MSTPQTPLKPHLLPQNRTFIKRLPEQRYLLILNEFFYTISALWLSLTSVEPQKVKKLISKGAYGVELYVASIFYSVVNVTEAICGRQSWSPPLYFNNENLQSPDSWTKHRFY